MSDNDSEVESITFVHHHTRGDGNCLFHSFLIAFGQPCTSLNIQLFRNSIALRIYDLKKEILDEFWPDNDPYYLDLIGNFQGITPFEKAKLIARYYAQMGTYGDENIIRIMASIESIIIRVFDVKMELIANFKPRDIFENQTLRGPKRCFILRLAYYGVNSNCNHYSLFSIKDGEKEYPTIMTLAQWRKIQWET